MERVDFVFLYEVKARELDNVCLIAAKLENMGYSVGFVNSWYCLTNPEEKKRYSCKVLIISAAFDTASIKYFVEHVVDFNYVISLQWEQIMSKDTLANEEYRWNLKELAKEIPHISWGRFNYDVLSERSKLPTENIILAGHTSLDLFRPEFDNFFISKEDMFKKFGLDKYTHVSLFISSFTLVNQRKVFLDTAKQSQDVEDMVELSEKTQKELFSWFQRYLTANPQRAIVYRPHPEEINSESLKVLSDKVENLHVITELPIKPWIKHCDDIYTWVSTAIGEIWASGRSCYILRPLPLPTGKEMMIFLDAQTVTDYEQFLDTQQQQEYSFPINRETMEYFYLFENEPNYIKVANFLDTCIKENRKTDATVKKELQANLKYQKRENSIYGTVMDFIAINTALPFANFEQRRKTYSIRADQKNNNTPNPDEHTLYKMERNYAGDDEINAIKQKLKTMI